MKPAEHPVREHPELTVRFAEEQDEYDTLPAARLGNGSVYSRWELTGDERCAILDGACIELWVWPGGGPLQPMMMAVEGVRENSAMEKEDEDVEGSNAIDDRSCASGDCGADAD